MSMEGVIDLTGPIVLDLDEVRDEPVSEGWHTIIIERAEPRTSSEGTAMIFVMSRITDESDPDDNRTVIWNSMLGGGGLVFTKRAFAALGLPAQLNYPTAQELCDDLVGRGCDVRVRHGKVRKGPRTGEMQANVSHWQVTQYDALLVEEEEEVPF